MSTIAFLAFFLTYILDPSSPITWTLMAVTLCTLAWDTKELINNRKDA